MAKKFWTYLKTNKYDIGLTSKTTYIFDKNGNEKAKFADLSYGNNGLVSPDQKTLVVKSTDGRIAIYSLEELKLIKKFRFSKEDGSQDDNLIFSPDGKYLLNIERHGSSFDTALTIYDTNDFSPVERLFENDNEHVLSVIEYDEASTDYYILACSRNPIGKQIDKCFVAKLVNKRLEEMRYVDESTFMFFTIAKQVEFAGFTEEAYKWLFLFGNPKLSELKNMNLSLSHLWKEASNC